jgi:hypothetical protein
VLFRNEQRITQFVLPHWIQMHKRRLFTDLPQSWYALENKQHKGTDCANMKLAGKVYQINDNRADNLQPARIVYRLLSGDVLHPAAALRNDLSAVSYVSAV